MKLQKTRFFSIPRNVSRTFWGHRCHIAPPWRIPRVLGRWLLPTHTAKVMSSCQVSENPPFTTFCWGTRKIWGASKRENSCEEEEPPYWCSYPCHTAQVGKMPIYLSMCYIFSPMSSAFLLLLMGPLKWWANRPTGPTQRKLRGGRKPTFLIFWDLAYKICEKSDDPNKRESSLRKVECHCPHRKKTNTG